MGAVNAVRAAVPVMRRQRSGSIILTASVAGLTAWSHAAPYCATKAAVIHLAKVAAVEYARDHIRVNCVCPGTFLSAIHADLPARRSTPSPRSTHSGSARPTDLVGAYSYLASDASRWTTGSVDRRRRRLLGAVAHAVVSNPALAGDHDVLDLVGPFADLEHLRIAVEAGDGRLEHVAHSAVDLHRLGCSRHGQTARLQLGHRRFLEERLPGIAE